MKILLNGEDINLEFTYAAMRKIEKSTGVTSFVQLAVKAKELNIAIVDVVDVYYYLQDGTAFSQEDIFDKIMKDGFSNHLARLNELLGVFLTGKEYNPIDGDVQDEKK